MIKERLIKKLIQQAPKIEYLLNNQVTYTIDGTFYDITDKWTHKGFIFIPRTKK